MSINGNNNNSRQDDDFNIDEELKKKIKLNDESEEFLYARGPKYDYNLWPIQCFLCRWTYITNERKFRSHIKGDRHTENLKKAEIEPPNAEEYRQIYEQVYSDRNNLKNPIRIYPGEDIAEITPEYADRLLPIKVYKWNNPPTEKVTEQLTPDIIMDYNKNCPILGLCYGFKMAKNNKIRYYCALCNINLDETNSYQHFISIEHSIAYAEIHYPETLKILPSDITPEQKIDVIRFYYHKIEGWKGFRPFYLVNANYFDTLKDGFLPRVSKIYHYNENTVKFDADDIKMTAENIKSGKKLVPEFLTKLPNQPDTENDCMEIDTSSEPTPKANEFENDRNPRRRDRSSSMKRPRDERANDRIKRLGLDDSPANWQKYRLYCDKALRNLNVEYARFLDISERHPKYQEEWRRFYRMKTEQLREDRINPNNYNFMPDWNRYWMRYLEDCYNADAEKCRFEIRKTLKLPFRCSTPPPTDNVFGNNSATSAASTSGSDNNSSNDPSKKPVPLMDLAISNPCMFNFQSDNVGGNDFRSFNRSDSRENDGGGNNLNKNNNNSGASTQEPQPLISEEQLHQVQHQQKTENSGTISVLSVLRLLAALELELGSLGPMANQLLGKAVLYEKESKLSANELLHENDYFTLFVTGLEKLKGVVQAGIVADIRINAANKCINELETILNLFDEYLRRNPNAAQKHITSNDVLGSRDANEISKKETDLYSSNATDRDNMNNNDANTASTNACYSIDDIDLNKKASAMNTTGTSSNYGYDNGGTDNNVRKHEVALMEPMNNANIEDEIPSLMGNNFRRGNPFTSNQRGVNNW